jgi:hypothetical protein
MSSGPIPKSPRESRSEAIDGGERVDGADLLRQKCEQSPLRFSRPAHGARLAATLPIPGLRYCLESGRFVWDDKEQQ